MRDVRRVILEALLIGVVGLAIGLAANAVNPKSLALTRDYFRSAATRPTSNTQPTTSPDPSTGHVSDTKPATTPTNGEDLVVVAAVQAGLQVIGDAETFAAFNDPRRQAGQIVFVDARSEPEYAAGHIPGAYQFDHYRFDERTVAEVLPVVMAAEMTIIYCNGGSCDDSVQVGMDFMERGADPRKLHVYTAGMSTWRDQDRPVEHNHRNSTEITGGEGQ